MNELAVDAAVRFVLMVATFGVTAASARLFRGSKAYLFLFILTASLSWFIWSTSSGYSNPQKVTVREILANVGIRRSFSSNDLKKTRRAIHIELHPDLQTSAKQSASLTEFQNKENLLEVLANPVKRELIDRFSFDAIKTGLDDDLLREAASNLTMIELTAMLPRSSPWLVGIGMAIFKSPAHAAKPLLNLLIFKFLWELYLLVLQPVSAADAMDLVLPFTTLAERRALIDFIFAILCSLALLHWVFGKERELVAQLPPEHSQAADLQELLRTLGVSFKVKAN